MSAWDFTGAVVASVLLYCVVSALAAERGRKISDSDFTLTFALLAWDAFCIARLCGARL